MVYKDLNKLM